MADIFLSYSREDRVRAEALASALSDAGWSVFWDRLIPTGRRYESVIETELSAAYCAVVLWSRHSIDSDWVKDEASEALRRDVLHPALIDDVRIPLGFGRVQTANLKDWRPGRPHVEFDEFVGDLGRRLAARPRGQSTIAAAPGPSPASTRAQAYQLAPSPDEQRGVSRVRGWRLNRSRVVLAAVVLAGAIAVALGARSLLERDPGSNRPLLPTNTALEKAPPSEGPSNPPPEKAAQDQEGQRAAEILRVRNSPPGEPTKPPVSSESQTPEFESPKQDRALENPTPASGAGGKRSKAPEVLPGQAAVRGGLDKEIVRRIIRRHVNELKYCYEQELVRKPRLSGRVSVQFTIGPNGHVLAALVQSSTMGNEPVETCVVTAVRRWEFPTPIGGGIVIVTYPFSFAPAGG